MKRYIIKYADGREPIDIQDLYKSRKEAGDVLMSYIYRKNEDLDINNDGYLSPFDFILEEVECKDVNEEITDFESARDYIGFSEHEEFDFQEVASLVKDLNPKHIKALIALNKLYTISEAWNKADGFVPDFSDLEQDKWFPWFKYERTTGFVYAYTASMPSYANASFGSRLCFKTSRRAEQFGKQFAGLYNEVFLLND